MSSCLERNIKGKEQYYLQTSEEAAEEHDRIFFNRRTDIVVGMKDPRKEAYCKRIHRRRDHVWHMSMFKHCPYCDLGYEIIDDDSKVEIL